MIYMMLISPQGEASQVSQKSALPLLSLVQYIHNCNKAVNNSIIVRDSKIYLIYHINAVRGDHTYSLLGN